MSLATPHVGGHCLIALRDLGVTTSDELGNVVCDNGNPMLTLVCSSHALFKDHMEQGSIKSFQYIDTLID